MFYLILLIFSAAQLQAGDGTCKKCEMLRDYHANNPAKYTFYDDYLKDKEAGLVEEEDAPEEIQFIRDLPKVSVLDNS